MGHVFTRVSGYGVSLLPEPGTSLSAIETPTAVRIRTSGEPECTISIDSARRALGNHTSIFEAGIELTSGTDAGAWQLETSVFTCDWPRDLELVVPQEAPDPPFYLLGSGEMSIWINGPVPRDRIPTSEKFRSAGQTVRKTGRTGDAEWIEVSYAHDGESWMQRYHFVPWISREVLVAVVQSLDREAPPDFVAKFIASIRETRDAEHGS